MAGGGDSPYSQQEQAQVLSIMLSELASLEPVAVIWFQVFDRLYLEAPEWASAAFNHIGMMDLAGTPKESFLLWQKVHALPGPRAAPRRAQGRVGGP